MDMDKKKANHYYKLAAIGGEMSLQDIILDVPRHETRTRVI